MNEESQTKKFTKKILSNTLGNVNCFLNGISLLLSYLIGSIPIAIFAILWYFIFSSSLVISIILIVITIFLYLLLSGLCKTIEEDTYDLDDRVKLCSRFATLNSFFTSIHIALIYKFWPAIDSKGYATWSLLFLFFGIVIFFVITVMVLIAYLEE